MNNFNKSNNIHSQMKKEYLNKLAPDFNKYLTILNLLISSIETNSFNMPLIVQNQIHITLLEAKQILNTLSINKGITTTQTHLNNDPLSLLLTLNTLSLQLNQHSIKSPYYILLNKTNNLILNCTNKILNHFTINNRNM